MAARARIPAAVGAARGRRAGTALERGARIEWYMRNVSDTVRDTMRTRVKLATDLVKYKVVHNISRPVTKISTGTGRDKLGRFTKAKTGATNRSKPGEFPKADTTQLMKSIFSVVRRASNSVYDGFVGTPLDYGVILETRMDRSFLRKTLEQERSKVMRILSGPIKK